MPNEPVKITAQELEEIKKLPSCQFMLGGTPQTGFFDKVNEKIYYLDSEGNWMVKRARVKKREPEKPQEEEAPAEENGEEEESGKRRWLRRKAKSDVEDESEDGRSRLDALKESLNQPLFEKNSADQEEAACHHRRDDGVVHHRLHCEQCAFRRQ